MYKAVCKLMCAFLQINITQIVNALRKAKVTCPEDIKKRLSACFVPSGVIALADAISANGAMTTLNISSNYLYDAGTDALASALKAPSCALTSVDASDNKLTDKGKKALQQAAGSR